MLHFALVVHLILNYSAQLLLLGVCRGSAYSLLGLAWVFSVCVIADCTFIRFGLSDTQFSDLGEVGIFQVNLDAPQGHRCAAFSNSTPVNAGFKAARAFGVLASLMLGVAMMQVACLQLFVDYKREFQWLMVKIQIISSLICEILTFSAFSQDDCSDPDIKCVPGAVGILAIFNILILMVLSWIYCVLSPPEYPLFEISPRVPPPPRSAPPPTLQEVQIATGEPVEQESASMGISTKSQGRGADKDEDIGNSLPPRDERSFNDGIEDPAVPLDKIEDEDSF